MTSFLDGPVAGQSLFLHRAPLFLRVCQGVGGIDALDQLDDEPAEGEVLFAYRRVGKPGTMFIDYTDQKTRRRKGKVLQTAQYRVVTEQPAADVMASAALWRDWCQVQWDLERKAVCP